MVSNFTIGHLAELIARLDPAATGRPRTPLRSVLAAIVYHLRTGGAWRRLPGGYPPWRTVYEFFIRWMVMGIWDALLQAIAVARRRDGGRSAKPTLCIIDTQSVTCIGVAGLRGYDAGKKILGRKRVALVDTDGSWLAVVPASVQDRDCLEYLEGKVRWPSLRTALFDGGFVAERCVDWRSFHDMRHELVKRTAKGFVVLPRRWVVERSFGWLSHWAGLVKDRAGRLDVAAARIISAAVVMGLEGVINPIPARVS